MDGNWTALRDVLALAVESAALYRARLLAAAQLVSFSAAGAVAY